MRGPDNLVFWLPLNLFHGTSPQAALRFHTLKVDKALFYVDANEFDSEAITNVESMSTCYQLSFDGRLKHSNPSAVFRGPGHQGVEATGRLLNLAWYYRS